MRTRRAGKVYSERVAKMADRIAKDDMTDSEQAVFNIDAAVDSMIAALITIEENLSAVEAENESEKKALSEIKDLLETALTPYTSDLAKVMQEFGSD